MAKFVFLCLSSCVLLGASAAPHAALADGTIIWTPTKVAPRVYQTTVGLRLPTPMEASAGADLGLGSGPQGRLLSGSELATLWGKVVDNRKTLDGSDNKALVINIDTVNRTSSVSLSRSKKWIYSPTLDLQTSRSLSLNYAAANSEPASVNATQSLSVIYPSAGTTFTAGGTLASDIDAISGTLALNQPIAANLNLTASYNAPISATGSGDVQMRYQIKW